MLLRTLWMNRIMENLFASNEFINEAQNWDEYVHAGIKTVVIPQSGTPAGYERNRTTVPATITERADGDISFDMTDYTSNPTLVKKLDQVQVSYDKMRSVIQNMLLNIQDGVALDMLYAWRTEVAASLVETTGASETTTLTGTTGNRKRVAYADLVALQTKLDNQEVPQSGRILLLPSVMYNSLLLDQDIKENFNSKLADLNKGVAGEILGFKVMKRSKVLSYTDAGVAKLPTAAAAATDSHTGLAWHPMFVGRSKGNIDVFADAQDRPEYYGRVMSCELQAGGKKAYSDGKGVVALRQANV